MVQPLHCKGLATLPRFPKSKITVHAADHNPSHFHMLANEGAEALIHLAALRLLDGSLQPGVLMKALA